MKKIPSHMVEAFGTARKFRAHHRMALKKAHAALVLARNGCAYSPGYHHLLAAITALAKAIDATRPENWEKAK
jgi:hypothetical protein